jgi:hypothetical protein
MGVCAADMDSCDKKAKCIFGPNEGKAYNPKDPCCGQGVFDPATCDCTCLRYRFTTTMYFWGYTYTTCNREERTEPQNSYTETWIGYGRNIELSCIDWEWSEFVPGNWYGDEPASYRILKDPTCNPPDTIGVSVTDFFALSQCFEQPFSACDTYYYTIDLIEKEAEGGGWEPVPGPYE